MSGDYPQWLLSDEANYQRTDPTFPNMCLMTSLCFSLYTFLTLLNDLFCHLLPTALFTPDFRSVEGLKHVIYLN